MQDRAAIVISFDVPPGKNSLMGFQENLNKVKPIFEGDSSVKVYGAVSGTAEAIIEILEDSLTTKEDTPEDDTP